MKLNNTDNKPSTNISLVQTIIRLHEQGYCEDFFINEKGELIWGQNGFPIQDNIMDLLEIRIISTKHIKSLLYRITFQSGTRGLLLCQSRVSPAHHFVNKLSQE